ncbi:MAG TPA: RNA polymerase sigma factor [Kofleriaceae bacterium]|jgi:RNA polymerase sigma-70 factor (ECF subfamily)
MDAAAIARPLPVAHASADANATPADATAATALAIPVEDPIAGLIQDGRYRDAVTACASTHGTAVGRVCMALLGSSADADEAVQETLLRAHRGMSNYRGEGSVKSWLCGIARHVCAHMLETRKKQRELLEVVPTDGEAKDVFLARRRARVVRDALAKLKPSEREALVLRYVSDLSHRELAVATNLDEPTARKRVSRALANLRRVLPDEELE